MCEDEIIIMSTLQKYIFNWYHNYFLHPVMDRMEEIIWQHLCWTSTNQVFRNYASNCDTCQRKQLLNQKFGEVPDAVDEEIKLGKIYVYLIGPY